MTLSFSQGFKIFFWGCWGISGLRVFVWFVSLGLGPWGAAGYMTAPFALFGKISSFRDLQIDSSYSTATFVITPLDLLGKGSSQSVFLNYPTFIIESSYSKWYFYQEISQDCKQFMLQEAGYVFFSLSNVKLIQLLF